MTRIPFAQPAPPARQPAHLAQVAPLAMFGLGTTEIVIIVIVALLVIGPAKLPEVARSIGKGLRELRRVSDDFQREMARSEYDDEDGAYGSRRPPDVPRPRGDASSPPPEVHVRPAEGAVAQVAEAEPADIERANVAPAEAAADTDTDAATDTDGGARRELSLRKPEDRA